MRIEIARLHKDLKATIIYVTHDQVEAMTLAQTIVVLREGRVEQVGAPLTLYDDPSNLFVAGFIGSPGTNFLKAKVAGNLLILPDFTGQTVPLPALKTPLFGSSEVNLGLRPEAFRKGGSASLNLMIDIVEHLGDGTFAYASPTPGGPMLTLAVEDGRDLTPGQTLTGASTPPARCCSTRQASASADTPSPFTEGKNIPRGFGGAKPPTFAAKAVAKPPLRHSRRRLATHPRAWLRPRTPAKGPPMSDASFRFTHAISRRPAAAITMGLRAVDTGTPDLALMRAHHAAYVAALRGTGATVILLDALEAFPDSVFVEDTALCLPQGAVIMRPGAPSRLGEAAEMHPHLARLYGQIARVTGPDACIEGGDILVTGHEILVGRSARTNAAGIAALDKITSGWGHKLREVITPPGVLHFKTDCALLDADTILATRRLDASGCFAGYKVIHTAPGEDAAANAVRFNDVVLMADGFPGTAALVRAAGFSVHLIGNTECARIDGGMSCLSLRFTPSR